MKTKKTGVCEPFKYLGLHKEPQETPKGYNCTVCGASGVRLFRDYQTFADQVELHCLPCAMRRKSCLNRFPEFGWPRMTVGQCGGLVAAVPTEDGQTFWGFSSVPEDGVRWYERLPFFNTTNFK